MSASWWAPPTEVAEMVKATEDGEKTECPDFKAGSSWRGASEWGKVAWYSKKKKREKSF